MTAKDPVLIISQQGKIINSLLSYGNGNNSNHGLSWQILPLLLVKIAVNPKGLTAFCALLRPNLHTVNCKASKMLGVKMRFVVLRW